MKALRLCRANFWGVLFTDCQLYLVFFILNSTTTIFRNFQPCWLSGANDAMSDRNISNSIGWMATKFGQTFMISTGWMAQILIIHCFFLLHHHLSSCGFGWYGLSWYLDPIEPPPGQKFNVWKLEILPSSSCLGRWRQPCDNVGFQLDWNTATGSLVG